MQALLKAETEKFIVVKLTNFKVTDVKPPAAGGRTMACLHSVPGSTMQVVPQAVAPEMVPDGAFFTTVFAELVCCEGHCNLIGKLVSKEPLTVTTRGNERADGVLVDACGLELKLVVIGTNAAELDELDVGTTVLVFGGQLAQARVSGLCFRWLFLKWLVLFG